MIQEILLIIGGVLTTGAAAFFGFVFGRREYNAKSESLELDNQIKVSDHHKKMLDDLAPRYEREFVKVKEVYEQKTKILSDEVALLKRQVKLLNEQLKMQTKENFVLKNRIKELESCK